MVTILVVIAIVVVVAHLQWRARRRGRLESAVVARDIGFAALALYILIEGSRYWIDYAWWKSLEQTPTFWQYLRIRWLPQTAMAILAALLLMAAFGWARRRCGSIISETRLFGLVGYTVSAVVGALVSINSIDPWVIALYLGAHPAPSYADPVFHHNLTFYMFRLPFYQMIFDWIAALAIVGLILVAVATALGSSAERLQQMRARMMAQMEGRGYAGPMAPMGLGARDTMALLVRWGAVLLLVLFAVAQWFARYGLLYSQHSIITGADFVDVRLGLPLLWVQIVGALVLAGLIAGSRRRSLDSEFHRYQRRATTPDWMPANAPAWLAPAAVAAFLILAVGPSILQAVVRRVYVIPNQLRLETPYITDHIKATRLAYDLEQTSHEESFVPRSTDSLDLSRYPDTTNNIRLWDAGPFQDDVTQLQALRPYYAFPHVDIERYRLQGQTQQVMLAARALDTNLLPASAQSWVNLSLQYTHGYGAVAARVNAATPEGQPELLLQDAPPVGPDPSFQIKRPGVYFGEDTVRNVYVDTRQDEFDYPKGDDNSYTTYAGSAGIVLANPLLRLAAAIQQNDVNVVLSGYFTPQTRLLLHRQIVARVERMAPFLQLDADPYLVLDSHGHLYWILDAYTTSDQHPYAESILFDGQPVNYIRNSVKVTVDAYNGTVRMYVFDPSDPVLAAYRSVFPHLFQPRSAMPSDLLDHIRYPQDLFEAQAEMYRLYHMEDPQVFYNKEDQWDIARQVVSQEETQPTRPYYVMLQLPGDTQAEFVLMVPFTSHSRDNLIAWVAARCDPAHYGEIIFYRLPKEQLIYGPLQIQSRVDQNRDISKDLSLWNQQGSRVIRATTLVLPVDGTFVYVEPIYIQAPQAKLPELKKVVLAVGNRLVYSDDLPSAIAELAQPPGAVPTAVASTSTASGEGGLGNETSAAAPSSGAVPPGPTHAISRAVAVSIQQHIDRYRQLTAQGELGQAGAELQAATQQLEQAIEASAPAAARKK